MGAMALTGMVGFTACSSDDVVDQPEISKNDLGKEVVTKFAMNLSAAPGTRSTPDIVQEGIGTVSGRQFRGMESIFLIPMNFAQANANGYLYNSYAGKKVNVSGTMTDIQVKTDPTQNFNNDLLGTTWSTNIFSLGDLAKNEITTTQSSKVYSLTLPVGTSNFLFYGKAVKSGSTLDDHALQGNLSWGPTQSSANAAAINFALQPIVTASTITTPQTNLLKVLNDIENATYNDGTTDHAWRAYKESTDNNFVTLKNLYNNFTGIGATNIRAGSAEAVRATVQELYRTALSQRRQGETPVVKGIAASICSIIESNFTIYFDMTAGDKNVYDTQVAAADVDKQTTAPAYDYPYYAAYLKFNTTAAPDANTANYPIEQGLPAGAARLQFASATHTFSYLEGSAVVDPTNNGGSLITKITHPAELTYFANSALRATEVNKEVADYPVTVDDWDNPDNADWNDWTLDYVTTGTRAVAMKDNINYGVALLKSTVSNSYTELYDKRAAIVNDGITQDQKIEINDKSFILTGVLVGGQPDNVGWDFLPTGTESDRNMVVYDRMMASSTTATPSTVYSRPVYPDEAYDKADGAAYNYMKADGTATVANYTLVLDNYKYYNGDVETQKANQITNVAVALEFINNTGKDFYGKDGVIPAGGTFYLAGALNTNERHGANRTINWNYTGSGTKNTDYRDRFPAWGVDRIFVQDHTTEAKFSFTEDALKNAYSTIPDLRSIQMLFGLSVDLQWLDGLDFNVPL